MKNLKDKDANDKEAKAQRNKGWKLPFALALALAFAAAAAFGPAQLALADTGGAKGHSFDSTFTKWASGLGTPPVIFDMLGVVGGDVGEGTYSGEVLSYVVTGNFTYIEALYHFHGSKHSFTAHLNITQDNTLGTAVLSGVVEDGWQVGAPVSGEYTVLDPCPIPTPGNIFGTVCFQGTLHIQRGSDD
jgi:hypothetical protein